MGISWWQILIVALLVVLLFGRGRISGIMGDVARGIRSFRTGLREEVTHEIETSESEKEKDKV